MEITLNIDMTNPKNKKALEKAIKKKWSVAVRETAIILQKKLPRLLVDGGGGFRGFTSTSLWQFLGTQKAWGELGFPNTQPLYDLVDALIDSIIVKSTKGKSAKLVLQFVDMKMIAKFTEHPAAGQGQLRPGLSWFVDWVIKGKPVSGYRFKQESISKKGAARSLSELARSAPIAGPEAGIMVKKGMWDFPPIFRSALDDWLIANMPSIKKLVYATLKKTIGKA